MALPQITATGTMVADPELRYTPNGAAVANFRIACNTRMFNKDTNAWEDGDTTFIACTAWKNLGENIAETLHKGDQVNVVGRLRQRTYQTREGENRTVYDVEVDEVGPSLKWATAALTKNSRSGGGGKQQSDPWKDAPQAGGFAGAGDEEPPF